MTRKKRQMRRIPTMRPTKPFQQKQLKQITASSEWFEEPSLTFGGGSMHVDPKVGIPLYGPASVGTSRHKTEVHAGFIGTGEGIQKAMRFYETCCDGLDGDDQHAPFPGCKIDRGYRFTLKMDDSFNEKITQTELGDLLKIRDSKQRFDATLELLTEKLRLMTQEHDHPLNYVVLVVPPEMFKECRVADYHEKGVGMVHRDLRRAFKARAMQYNTATQIIQESTLNVEASSRELDHLSERAWNLFNGLYFKVDGLPWGPADLPASSCFVGVSFYRPLGQASTLRTSLVQAFDENGEGLVLRGHNFNWDEQKQGKTPHLTEDLAAQLIDDVLEQYEKLRHQRPTRIVVHKTSRFDPDETRGFQRSLRRVSQCDLVALRPTSEIRLIRAGSYPPLRGTSFTLGDVSFLYTTGYIPFLGRFPQGHVPSPLELADHIGDTPRSQLLKEALALTKMNWNSARMYGLMPITVRFARLVGDILREVPENITPHPKYKFYV
ncbi:hypothetical protein DES53_111131 [Roseimicrobium gellanilyticum]|uniref:Protein argonaute n=2 Tax=Roseimicrobium gellanilyticum TaxID=748857 RepID=A0A366HAK5_9BACT|nr:hypothetical protein DES53_111131 [Roseimicrobium gellanilyticum]